MPGAEIHAPGPFTYGLRGHAGADLALKLDNLTNNTSLAIAIERVSGKNRWENRAAVVCRLWLRSRSDSRPIRRWAADAQRSHEEPLSCCFVALPQVFLYCLRMKALSFAESTRLKPTS